MTTRIYKLTNDIDDEIYVGSTKLPMSWRMSRHKEASKTRKSKLYKHINNIGVEHFHIELIKEVDDENGRIEEERMRKELRASLNSNSCYGKDIERYKKYQREYQRMYRNRDFINHYFFKR